MTQLNNLVDVNVVFSIFIVTVFISIFLSFFIIFLILFIKTLHSPSNLLICHTCFATILYVTITTIKICLFYMESIFSDWWCRILAYLGYTALIMTVYSYVIQGLSRLFFIIFYNHRHLLQYKSHIIIIVCQVFISFIIPLPSLITKDVVFRESTICYIRSEKLIHIAGYSFISTFVILFFIIIIIYGVIYCRVIQSSTTTRQSSQASKRDLALIKNILILFMFFFLLEFLVLSLL